MANLGEHESAEQTDQPRTSVSSTDEGTLPSRPSAEGNNELSFELLYSRKFTGQKLIFLPSPGTFVLQKCLME